MSSHNPDITPATSALQHNMSGERLGYASISALLFTHLSFFPVTSQKNYIETRSWYSGVGAFACRKQKLMCTYQLDLRLKIKHCGPLRPGISASTVRIFCSSLLPSCFSPLDIFMHGFALYRPAVRWTGAELNRNRHWPLIGLI